jgi:hypothetical protein
MNLIKESVRATFGGAIRIGINLTIELRLQTP